MSALKKTFAAIIAAAALLCLLSGCAVSDFSLGKKLTVITREEGSGTRDAFVSLFDIRATDEQGREYDATVMTADTQPSTGVVITSVAGNQNAIGYISIGALNDGIKPISVDGAAPSAENIKNGSYKVTRSFDLVMGESPDPLAQDFLDFCLSGEGQAVVEAAGYISVADGKPYSGSGEGRITVSGSSSVAPVVQRLKESYETLNPDAVIEVNISDSSTGISDAASGAAQLGMASRELKPSETAKALRSVSIATDGIALIVNPANSIESLTTAQIRAIYLGQALTWQEVLAVEK